MFDIAGAIETIAILAVPLLLGMTCHEVAHGYVAYLLGDPTAKAAGRLTLNPIKHLDPIGSLVFILTAITPPKYFAIGWAKPVPINPVYFKNPKKGMALCSLAGPGANFLIAVFFGLVMRLCIFFAQSKPGELGVMILQPLLLMSQAGIVVNLALMVFNLFPIPPLDGSKVLFAFLPREIGIKYLSLQRYGFILVFALLAFGLLGKILFPAVLVLLKILLFIVGLPPEYFF